MKFPTVLLSVLFMLPIAMSGAEARPNIIFLLTDDQRDNTLAAMGHPFVKTPNLDALMRDSVRFKNAYIATPVCCPSRVSYLTGLPERVHGVGFTSSNDLTEQQWERTYPALLRKGGYFTGFVGKFGVEYYSFKGHAAEKFDFWWGHDGWTRFLPKDFNGESTKPYHMAKNDIITPIMGEAMTKFLDTAPSDKPFCLSVSFNVPHGSQTTSMFTDYADWQKMTRPANENPKLQSNPFYDSLYRDVEFSLPADTCTDPYRFIPKRMMDQQKGRANQTYVYDYDMATCREHHIRYYQTITGLDHVIGELLNELKRRGLADNTIILYGSDHGLLMGEYGMGGKALLYDLASKIPCIIHDPRIPKEQRGRQLDQLVSSLDYTRTILDYAEIEAPAEMEGRNLRPLIEGKSTEWREELFLESLFAMRDNPFQEGIRTKRWKYIRMYDGVANYKEADVNFKGRAPEFEMLFDLVADPTEHHNLAGDPNSIAILTELREKTAANSIAINQRRAAYTQTFTPRSRISLPSKAKASK
ncbi:MAG: sulfatase-like hydrolase/transferase [Verrucomicrobiales bacterium]|nr:sulfatase-like hydrolase/transferase [Verrucomicrobiales bacterium]MCP5556619.1 sulfatase-like hydrolase/transferase [Verrucomicrobiaceae bacterium]